MKPIRKTSKNKKFVPMEQAEAAIELAAKDSTNFAIQMCKEQMLLMLHDQFGFGKKRCMRALESFQQHMTNWQESVDSEFDAETFRYSYKQKQRAKAELAFTWEKHDQALKDLISPEIWMPYQERYRDLYNRGDWCK